MIDLVVFCVISDTDETIYREHLCAFLPRSFSMCLKIPSLQRNLSSNTTEKIELYAALNPSSDLDDTFSLFYKIAEMQRQGVISEEDKEKFHQNLLECVGGKEEVRRILTELESPKSAQEDQYSKLLYICRIDSPTPHTTCDNYCLL